MISAIQNYCSALTKEFGQIPDERKILLDKITSYIKNKQQEGRSIDLVYICTHNSRRSHFGQVWAAVAAAYYGIKNVNSFSGGTEATAFNINAINALNRIGFKINAADSGKNPIYDVVFDEKGASVKCYSKKYDDVENPQKNFAAIMTCSDADENCPFVPGAELKVSTTYDDPKAFDGTPQQDEKYSERCRQIALETFYTFSKIKLL